MAPSLFNAAVRLALGPGCVACGSVLHAPLDSPVCASCWRAVVRLTPPCCRTCGDAVGSGPSTDARCARCRQTPPRYTMARSAAVYDGTLRAIVHAFKYSGCRALASDLARLMRQAGADALADADAVVPVPLHPWRALRRGFNQADDLACALGLPVWRVLGRARHGPPLAGQPRASRRRSVDGAFHLTWWTRHGPARARLPGATVVIIDDVMTTGATLDACASVLIDAGVSRVRALTVARAVARRPPPRPPRPRLSRAHRR